MAPSLSRERWSCFSGSACNVFWCPKMPSRRVFESVTSSSSWQCSACRQYWSSLLLLGLFSPSFPLLSWKLQLNPLCCWYINFSPFLFHHSILICYFFLIWTSFFWLFFWTFCWIDFLFNFTFQMKIYVHFFISILILVFFIVFWSFCSINFSFQFHSSIKNKIALYFNFDPYSFNCHLILSCNWYSFSKKILQYLIVWKLGFVVFSNIMLSV